MEQATFHHHSVDLLFLSLHGHCSTKVSTHDIYLEPAVDSTDSSINVYLVFGPFSSVNIERDMCKQWFASQMSIACSLMAALDCILMLRGAKLLF